MWYGMPSAFNMTIKKSLLMPLPREGIKKMSIRWLRDLNNVCVGYQVA